MERLTDKNDVGNYYYPKCFEKCGGLGASGKCDNCEIMTSVCQKLGKYEDLEEQGGLIKLPCKVGDIVYCIFNRYTKCTHSNEEFDEYNCQGCEYECDSKKENYVQDVRAYSLDWIVTNLNNFGKTVFLTKSEAEAKLKELRGRENDK